MGIHYNHKSKAGDRKMQKELKLRMKADARKQKRLEKEGIYCLHSKHISLCGGIDVCAFDKVNYNSKQYHHFTSNYLSMLSL